MKNVVNWLLSAYFIGSFITYKWGTPKLHDNYMLGAIIVFLLLVITKLYQLLTHAKKENYREQLFKYILSLIILLACLALYSI
ncbi:hypothetical protein [Flavobacterium sp.]|uniref:hypothetical protein n=1 Tax=Flavobacterium sp. TaxID=239 RepID=UPI00262007EC|nr:hypothetical protein [Flavobacterium sp.]